MKSPIGYFAFAFTLIAASSGCSVMKATQQPDWKNLYVLAPGTPRTHVIAELGAPVWTDEKDNTTTDVFAFKQGFSRWNKAGRAMVHGAADVATFGLWEVVGTPVETIANGKDMKLEVTYDANRKVIRSEVIKVESVTSKHFPGESKKTETTRKDPPKNEKAKTTDLASMKE